MLHPWQNLILLNFFCQNDLVRLLCSDSTILIVINRALLAEVEGWMAESSFWNTVYNLCVIISISHTMIIFNSWRKIHFLNQKDMPHYNCNSFSVYLLTLSCL